MKTHGIPLPQPTSLSRPFWDAANESRLVLQKCGDCGRYRWTPQILCPYCLGEPFEWREVSGKGQIYSYTVIHRPPLAAFDAPYVIATIELDEGPLMLSRLIDCIPSRVEVRTRVKVDFTRASEEINLYTFKPLA